MTLEELRKEIDTIDASLTDLLVKRMECSERIAEVKKETGRDVFDPAREKAVIDRVKEQSGAYGKYTADVYREILNVSKQIQQESKDKNGN